MSLRRLPFAAVAVLALSVSACGFHLRKEAELPPSMQRVYIEGADPSSLLTKDLTKALARSGTQVVSKPETDAAVMKIGTNAFTTDVLSVSGTARASEYALRYHVEFDVENSAGTALLPKQTIELSREFTFDASQALGVSAETDLLTKELQRDMVQTIMRRLEALAHAKPATAP
ncbi:MAG: LPS assembly lipoprotein LptE [Dokdonella sp.]